MPTPFFMRGQPAPPPDWRWQRAQQIFERNSYMSTKRDDELTCRMARYLKLTAKFCTERKLRQVDEQFPDLQQAQQVHNEGGPVFNEGGLRTQEIRARVLARQNDACIAAHVGLPVPTLASFVGLYFDIRNLIDARTYITRTVIGIGNFGNSPPTTLMLLDSYRHGPGAVEAWLDYLRHEHDHHDLSTRIGLQRESIAVKTAIRQLDAFGPNQKCFLRLAPVLEYELKKLQSFGRAETFFHESMLRSLNKVAWPSASTYNLNPNVVDVAPDVPTTVRADAAVA